MDRRGFLKVLGVAGFSAVLGARVRGGRRSKPNVILMMADDIGYECIGCYGSTYKTPVLDGLAAGGIRFSHCYSQPLCTPSRVKIMTGRYNFRNYVRFGAIDLEQRTIGHTMKSAGYSTCIAGKWQLAGGAEKGPNKAGFDEYCLWHMEDFDKPKGPRYANPKIVTNGKAAVHEGKYGPDVVCDYICDFIDRKKGGPFLVYYPMILTHAPFDPTPDSDGWKPNKVRAEKRYYSDMVTYMDKCIGRLVSKLDELGLREDTLILWTGDNGTPKGIETPMKDGGVVDGGKGMTTDAGTHVGFVANWKGSVPGGGRVCDSIVDFSDFLPTLAEVGGAEAGDVDGESFLPQLMGGKGKRRDWIHIWYQRDPGNKVAQFVRDKRWKLYSDGRFYDVANDVLEKDVIAAGAGSGEAEAARKRLGAALRSVRK